MSYKLAIFSIVQNETVWPEIWTKHYASHVPSEDIFLLDHDSDDDSKLIYESLRSEYGINVLPVSHYTTHHHSWLVDTVSKFLNFLLNSYDAVLYTDIDEIVIVHPHSDCATIAEFAEENLLAPRQVIRCTGYEVVHQLHLEESIDFKKPLLSQRQYWYHSILYSKPLLVDRPVQWSDGFHSAEDIPMTEILDRELLLLHLHKIDFDYALRRHHDISSRNWSQYDKNNLFGYQNLIIDRKELASWFAQNVDNPPTPADFVPIPEIIRDLI